MPSFSNLDSPTGLAVLNEFLADNSYIVGVQASQADVAVLEAVGGPVDAGTFPNVARWHKHVASFPQSERAKWGGSGEGVVVGPPRPAASADAGGAEEDEELDADDLFDSDDDEADQEAYRRQQERAAAALREKEKRDAEKASKGKAVVAKSSVLFDVKPWEADTDMQEMEAQVRKIEMPGLTWGAAKLTPVGFGIKKLQIMATIIDDLVPSTDLVTELIEEIEDYVQSVDIAAFNKI